MGDLFATQQHSMYLADQQIIADITLMLFTVERQHVHGYLPIILVLLKEQMATSLEMFGQLHYL